MKADLGNDASGEDMVLAVLSTFYPDDPRQWTDCMEEFNELLQRPIKYKNKLRLDFENKPASYFITADTYSKMANLVALYNHLSGKSVQNISVQLAYQVDKEFLQSVEYFRDKYEWIYNPPSVGKITPYTPGKAMRSDFQQDYGSFAEITYLLAKGDAMKFDEVNKMKLSEYLALGEYLLRKRIVESVD